MSDKPKAPEVGLLFPKDPRKGDERGSTFGNKNAWAAAIGAISEKDAERVFKEKQWRQKYNKYVVKLVELSAGSYDKALKSANAGLDYLYKNFEFGRDGKVMSFGEAMDKFQDRKFKTGFVKGTAPKPKSELKVPYKGVELSGDALLKQLDAWCDYGTIEPSCRDAIAKVVKNPGWLDLSDSYFVLLGAGSAMGPFPLLMALGANIIAIDLDRPGIWKRLISVAKNSPGTITFPTKVDTKGMTDDEIAEVAGCNLFTETPEIRNWLVDLYPGKQFFVGAYAYLDGELHVKVSLAMDGIIRDLTTKRKAGAAYLCTPTDVHFCGKEAHDAAEANYSSGLVSTAFKAILTKNARQPITAEDGSQKYIVDALVNAQGPNYALAKRMQHWRAVVAREEAGCIVSSNIAPSTSTVSVTHNRMFAWAYGGMPTFKPMEIFAPETSNAVMASLLIHDIRNTESVSNPKNKLSNPLELFQYGSFHGGPWRTAFTLDSIGAPSAIIYLLGQPQVQLGLGLWLAWIGFLITSLPK